MTDAGPSSDPETLDLLRRWHAGDERALGELVDRDAAWIQNKVRARLGQKLRQRAETVDFVQDAMVEVLRYGPRFEVQDRDHFRNFLARVVENVMKDKAKWWNAQRRAMAREQPKQDVSITLDQPANSAARPSVVAAKNEREARLRLALELLAPEDREVLFLRQWQELSFAEIADRVGSAENAVRMRFQRALPKLADTLKKLDAGELGALLHDAD